MPFVERWLPMLRVAAVAAAALGAACGCHWEGGRPYAVESAEVVCGSDLLWLSPVRIVPECSAAVDDRILHAFCVELSTALHAAGVPDVEIQWNCDPTCPTDSDAPLMLPDAVTEGPPATLMLVSVDDFRPYRQMRMAVDIRVVRPVDETDLMRIVDVFEPPLELLLVGPRSRLRLFRELRRGRPYDWAAGTTYQSNSPRWLLTHSAWQVVERIRFGGTAAPVPL